MYKNKLTVGQIHRIQYLLSSSSTIEDWKDHEVWEFIHHASWNEGVKDLCSYLNLDHKQIMDKIKKDYKTINS